MSCYIAMWIWEHIYLFIFFGIPGFYTSLLDPRSCVVHLTSLTDQWTAQTRYVFRECNRANKENLSYEMCDEMATVCKEGKIYIRWRRKGLTDYIRWEMSKKEIRIKLATPLKMFTINRNEWNDRQLWHKTNINPAYVSCQWWTQRVPPFLVFARERWSGIGY